MGGILMRKPTKIDAIISLVEGPIRWTDESDVVEYLGGQAAPTQSVIDTKLADDINVSLVKEQVELGVAVRMACLKKYCK